MYASSVAAAPRSAYAKDRAPDTSRLTRNASTVMAVRHEVMTSIVIDEANSASNGQVATSNAAVRPTVLPKRRRPSRNTTTMDTSDIRSG